MYIQRVSRLTNRVAKIPVNATEIRQIARFNGDLSPRKVLEAFRSQRPYVTSFGVYCVMPN